MSRTYLHTQQAKFKEELYKEDSVVQRFRGNTRWWFRGILPHAKKHGWHKLANKHEGRHNYYTDDLHFSSNCKLQLRHSDARRFYLQEKIENFFAPIKEPRFRKTKIK